MTKCKTCDKEIVWDKDAQGKWYPKNPDGTLHTHPKPDKYKPKPLKFSIEYGETISEDQGTTKPYNYRRYGLIMEFNQGDLSVEDAFDFIKNKVKEQIAKDSPVPTPKPDDQGEAKA
ncbi:MAG: hypothetical protein ACPLY9_02000 [Nitrososphaerales archaeon]